MTRRILTSLAVGVLVAFSPLEDAIGLRVVNVLGVEGVWCGTQSAYDGITTPDPNVLYFIKEV